MTRLNIKPAASGLHPHFYNPMVLTSLDYGQLVPMEAQDTLPSDDFQKVHYKTLMRLAPQNFPPYGKTYLKHATFFVPEHQVIESADAFHSNMNMYKGKSVVRPYIVHHHINAMFGRTTSSPGAGDYGLATEVYRTTSPLTDQTAIRASKPHFHMVYTVNQTVTYIFYKLSQRGRYYYKILKSLGIDFATFSYNNTYADCIASANSRIDLMAFLSYLKIYTDMFLNGQFYNSSLLVKMLHAIHDGDNFTLPGYSTLYDASTGEFKMELLFWSLEGILLPHEQNMFTEAWNSPNSPSGVSSSTEMISQNPSGLLSPISSEDGSLDKNVISDNQYDSVLTQVSSGGSYGMWSLTQLGSNFLNSIYKFARRFKLFGSKSVQRVFANFGIKTDDFNSHFVHKISEGAERIDFYPVLSNTDNFDSQNNTGKTLGAYAGFSYVNMDINYSHKCSDYGFIITLVWMQIVPILIHGTHAKNLRRYPFDWYTPEFDGKSIRCIPKMEVSRNNFASDSNTGDKSPYGFIDLYTEYREGRDNVSGDFLTSENVKDFFFGRDLSVIREDNNGTLAPQTDAVQYYDQDDNPDLNQPFQMPASEGDRMWLIFDGEIEAQRPPLSPSDALDLNGSGNLTLPKNGVIMN